MNQHDPIPILHLITELDAGGAQSALLRLLEQLDRSRFRPVVACFYNGNGLAARQIRELGIPVLDLGMTAWWRLDALWRLYRLLRRERPYILHCWLFHANFLGRIIGRLARVPIIITSRRNVEIGGRWREWLQRWTANLDDKTVAVCEAARQAEISAAGALPDKVVTIYNGIEAVPYAAADRSVIRREFSIADGAFLLGVVGRLHQQKGHVYLFEALAQVRRRFPDVRLLVVGDGRLRAELAAQTQQQNLTDNIIFTGLRQDIPQILAGLDLFVLPSLWEGLPNVVLEAMAAGLPVVATAVGGTPELVSDDETGLLVPAQDAAALAQAIQRLVENPAMARQMGKSGRQRVRADFSIRKMVEQTEQLYELLLNEKGLLD